MSGPMVIANSIIGDIERLVFIWRGHKYIIQNKYIHHIQIGEDGNYEITLTEDAVISNYV